MDLSQVPVFVAAKLAQLSDARAAAAVRDNELSIEIAGLRERLSGRVQRAGDNSAKLSSEVSQLLTEQKALQVQRPIDDAILESCRAWLTSLPGTAALEPVAAVVEDGAELPAVRKRTKALQREIAMLKSVPIPSADIDQKIKNHVRDDLVMPDVDGIAAGEKLTSKWPTHPAMLAALFIPDQVERMLRLAVERKANTHGSLADRQQRIAACEIEIAAGQRAAEAIVTASGQPRESGAPPWIVLGVRLAGKVSRAA